MTKRLGPLVSQAVMLQWRLPTSPLLAPAEGPRWGASLGSFTRLGVAARTPCFSPHPGLLSPPSTQ